CWQMAKFQLASRTMSEWNSSSFGFRIPLSCTPERKSDSRPSTTHARTVPYAPETGACTASARAGSMVVRSSESGLPATATGARMATLWRPVEVHEADRRDPIRPVADQALLQRLGGQGAARLPERRAIRLHVIDGGRAVVARRARSGDGRGDERRGGRLGGYPG